MGEKKTRIRKIRTSLLIKGEILWLGVLISFLLLISLVLISKTISPGMETRNILGLNFSQRKDLTMVLTLILGGLWLGLVIWDAFRDLSYLNQLKKSRRKE